MSISTFILSSVSVPQTLTKTERENSMHITDLIVPMDSLDPISEESVTEQRFCVREARPKSDLQNFFEG